MDIPKTQATCGTIYTTKTNRGGNQESVPNVACVFGRSIIDCHLGWSSLCIVCQMLPVSLECSLLIATSVGLHRQHLAQYTQRRPTEVAINNGHTKDTGNIWHTIHNDDQPRWQSIMDIPKTQATFGTIYTMLPVSLECPLLIATSVGLRCVYCAKCCLWHKIHNEDHPRWQSIMDIPKTQATFGTIYTTNTNLVVVYSVPNVACVFGMSIIDCHLGWSSLCILCQMLPVSEVAINNEHTKDTDNICHNIHNEDQPRWQSIMDIPKTPGLRCVYCAKCCLCLWNVHY
jgi:hypothetical protein